MFLLISGITVFIVTGAFMGFAAARGSAAPVRRHGIGALCQRRNLLRSSPWDSP